MTEEVRVGIFVKTSLSSVYKEAIGRVLKVEDYQVNRRRCLIEFFDKGLKTRVLEDYPNVDYLFVTETSALCDVGYVTELSALEQLAWAVV